MWRISLNRMRDIVFFAIVLVITLISCGIGLLICFTMFEGADCLTNLFAVALLVVLWAFFIRSVKKSIAVKPPVIPHAFCTKSDDCAICHEAINEASALLIECGHMFHISCIVESYAHKKKCPLCNKELPHLFGWVDTL